MVLMLGIYYHHEWTSGSNYIHMNINLGWVIWIHCPKVLWVIAVNDHVPHKFQLELVAVRIIHYSRVEIFYCCINNERHALPWNMEKGFIDIYFERHIRPNLSLPNGSINRRNLNCMGVLMLTPSCRNIIIWYLWVQNINIKKWQRKHIQCISIGSNKIIYRFS